MANRSDDFNRADSSTSLGTPSDGGAAWSALRGTFGISSNKAYVATNGGSPGNVAVLEASAADVEVQATLTIGNTASTTIGLAVRVSDSNNFITLFLSFDSATIPTLVKVVAGSRTEIIGDMGSVASGDTIKITCSGNTLTVYKNGAQIGTVSESFNNTATKHGLYTFSGTGIGADRWDDFSVTELGGAAGHPAARRLGGVPGCRPVEVGRGGASTF